MALQIIQQPNGKFAIFSTESDTFNAVEATEKEVIDYFVTAAALEATLQTESILRRIKNGDKRFAMSWEEAINKHQGENCTDDWNAEIQRTINGNHNQ